MLAQERQNAIVEEVNENGSVLVKELAEKYKVTEDSIRKDLSMLQRKGLLKKTYGGAMKVRNKLGVNELTASSRVGKHIAEKKKIARKAYKQLEDGDMIFLDLSTTNIEIARLIIENNKNVTVVTNMIEIVLLYAGSKNRQLICIGGNMNHQGDAFTGAFANRQIDAFHFDKCFMGLEGINLDQNCIFNFSIEDALTKKSVMENSEKSYMVLETRKLQMQGNYKYATIDEFDSVIVDQDLDEETLFEFQQKEMEVI